MKTIYDFPFGSLLSDLEKQGVKVEKIVTNGEYTFGIFFDKNGVDALTVFIRTIQKEMEFKCQKEFECHCRICELFLGQAIYSYGNCQFKLEGPTECPHHQNVYSETAIGE